jgi:F-type H+-transporting ATPase subunit b
MLSTIAVLAAEPGAENAFWLPHDINEVIWGSLAFAIVAFLLWKFARKPLAAMLSGRIEQIENELGQAAQARQAAEAERDRIKAALADSDSEAARIIAEARTGAEQLAADIEARTGTDITTVRERAAADLVSARTQAESDLSGELSRLSLGAAERVVETSLDPAAQQRLIDDYINQVGTQN